MRNNNISKIDAFLYHFYSVSEEIQDNFEVMEFYENHESEAMFFQYLLEINNISTNFYPPPTPPKADCKCFTFVKVTSIFNEMYILLIF